MTRESILQALPPFKNKRVLIKRAQTVSDIMKETLNAHEFFSKDYDSIASFFSGGSQLDTVKNLFNFLKLNVEYREESVRVQQTKSPAAILETGFCDCKCYALFIGGILDACNRLGGSFNWCYCYASYTRGVKTPGHVFVEVLIDGREYWIDPVLSSFDKRYPVPEFVIKKQKIKNMSLYRLAGTTDIDSNISEVPVPATNDVKISAGNIGEWIKQNPLLSAAVGIAIILLVTKKRR